MQPAEIGTPLRRTLGARHINLMALGATIGVGLFLGSATAIRLAGPSILLGYAFVGVFVFFVMRALGEMAVAHPVAGSFNRYAYEYIGPRAGFVTGWTYWFMWILCIMAEVTAVAIYMKFWFPGMPAWVWSLAALATMGLLNFVAVRAFGELEFWFAAIKIVTIVFMILSGIGIIGFGFGNGGVATGIGNLWRHGGFLPNGMWGLASAIPMVVFAYLGVEIIGLTAGETKNPEKSLARAVNSVFWRIAIFYIGALFIIMSLYPWNAIGTQGSPFVLTFERLGIRGAAGIINFVVLSAALSSCNSGIFGTARIVFNLAQQGQAPRIFAHTSKSGIPACAVVLTLVAALLGVLLNYVAPKGLFEWLTAIGTFAGLFSWAIILVAHYRFRRQRVAQDNRMLMPWWPYSSYCTLAFLAVLVAFMLKFDETRVAVIVGPLWLAFLWIVYGLSAKNGASRQGVPSPSASFAVEGVTRDIRD
ncbi:amino acid permease [Burkholderia vietnamiensis]|jgi:amino acid transporter, AAT family|uniref:AAT family amino acid transporter n=5 Tax=Bacteria TaxID=2 RepID=A0A0H3KPV6_BURM1|nr:MULTISPECIES: amino acid permease [Burkholderia cepacia complex]ABO57308.1 amino acid/polyamine/organocation transporter, APC superfamily [Burkholderia vietnamiensis G4]ABX18423.1 amino acid permease-associated region [Burkholderia multivorans ATCC 17616]AIO73409.1 amino acid permease family protein [Burkholderia multivorans]AMU14289.1 D-alanine/D-serine/glycine permease [Burkholderia cenocepacia]AOK64562.1 D-alanine/D-serine/glycine permease [Burkholderia multivorans]